MPSYIDNDEEPDGQEDISAAADDEDDDDYEENIDDKLPLMFLFLIVKQLVEACTLIT